MLINLEMVRLIDNRHHVKNPIVRRKVVRSREPEGRIDREPPTKKESNRPEKGRPSRNQETSNTPNKILIERVQIQNHVEDALTTVSPGKSQQRNAYNGGFNTSTRRTTQTQSGADEMGAWGFGLGTLSFASDYVDGGAYKDGGLRNVFGITSDTSV